MDTVHLYNEVMSGTQFMVILSTAVCRVSTSLKHIDHHHLAKCCGNIMGGMEINALLNLNLSPCLGIHYPWVATVVEGQKENRQRWYVQLLISHREKE